MADASAKPNTTISNSLGKKFWKKISDDPSSGVTVVNAKLHLVIPPYYLYDLRKSMSSVIDAQLNRYVEELGGILAGYGNLVIEHPKADHLFDLSDTHVDVVGEFYIFNPEVNKELTGIVNRKSIDHIGCLVHGLFKIALPKPFDLNSEQWPGKLAKINDNVRFRIGKVDLNSAVPYIEGRIIELIPNAFVLNSELRQRTSSDSGVSIASEEAMNIATTPEASMERKKSKLSLSQKKKIPVTVAIENDAVEEDKKRKRNLSEGSTTQETPKNKRAKLANNRIGEPASEDIVPVKNLATNLFAMFSEKSGGSPSRKQKKNQDASILVTASSLKTPLSETEPKLTKRPEVISEKVSSSDEDFVSSQKTPSQKKSKLAKKTDVEEKLVATPAKKTPAKEIPAKETPAKKTPSQPAKEASHKKSKTSVEKQSKKKAVVEDSDVDHEIIQEILCFTLRTDSTTIEKPVKQKKTLMSKTKLVDSEKKSKTAQKPPISTPVSLPVKETKTATSVKKNAKESSSGKSLKALSSEKNQETAEMNQEVFSTKKTPIIKEDVKNCASTSQQIKLQNRKIQITSSKITTSTRHL